MGSGGESSWRPIAPGQAAGWALLLAAMEAVDQTGEHVTEAELLADSSDPDRDFEHGSVAVYGGAAMVGFGLVGCAHPRRRTWIVHLKPLPQAVTAG